MDWLSIPALHASALTVWPLSCRRNLAPNLSEVCGTTEILSARSHKLKSAAAAGNRLLIHRTDGICTPANELPRHSEHGDPLLDITPLTIMHIHHPRLNGGSRIHSSKRSPTATLLVTSTTVTGQPTWRRICAQGSSIHASR